MWCSNYFFVTLQSNHIDLSYIGDCASGSCVVATLLPSQERRGQAEERREGAFHLIRDMIFSRDDIKYDDE